MTTDHQEEKGFAELFSTTEKKGQRLEPGQKVQARVVSIGSEYVFIDAGGKSEGFISRKECLDAEGNLTVNVGDTVTVFFLSAKRGGMHFTRSIGGRGGAGAQLEDAFRGGIPVNGRVEKEVKGGFEIKIAGARGFCPYSQIDLRRAEDPTAYIGQDFTFRITDYREGGRNIIVSRSVILKEEREARREGLKNELAPGKVVSGVITSIRDFGAFVDIDGLEGLIPASEISWERGRNIREVLNVGQQVEVEVLKLDWEADRFSFSLRRTAADPWETADQNYAEGATHRGVVARLAAFGAFVQLEPGVEGLLHISALGGGRKLKHPREVVKEGEAVDVRVESVDKATRRISLTLADTDPRRQASIAAENETLEEQREVATFLAKSRQEKSRGMGTLGELLKGRMERDKS